MTCRKCGVVMTPEPNPLGRELGDWWSHPRVPYGEEVGHDHSSFAPNPTTTEGDTP